MCGEWEEIDEVKRKRKGIRKKENKYRKEAEKYINKMNAYRSAYYKYHTGQEWENVKNYDLSLNTGMYTYQECATLIKQFVDCKMGL